MYKVGIITLSDKGAAGKREDQSGPAIREMLLAEGKYEVCREIMISDDRDGIEKALVEMADVDGMNLILTTGGTGFSPRDNTPEATKAVMTKDCPGISEYMRMKSCEITPKAMLSRGASVIRNRTLIINLPGSPKAVRENLGFILAALPHGLDILLELDSECATQVKHSKDREASFTDAGTAAWLETAKADGKLGLCFKKWHSDYVLAGISAKKVGDIVEAGGKFYQITKTGKRCFGDCELLKDGGKPCELAGGVAFGKAIGLVKSVCISEKKGEQKHPVENIQMKVDWGIEGDAHAGNWHRQVSLLAAESVEKMQEKIDEIAASTGVSRTVLKAGDFAENILTSGIDLAKLPIGSKLKVGSAVLEVTQIGKECHNNCAIREAVGDCIMPREGIFAKVIVPGEAGPGAIIEII